MRIVIVGGGLAGLSLAHRIGELAPAHEVVILEASGRAGGNLGTIERDGFVIETGPDSILREKRAAVELAERLGIADRVVSTNDAHRGAYVVCRGRLERVPEGFSLMAPTRFDAWMKTPVVSMPGKLRAALEVAVPPRREGEESLASFVRRRFGVELLERLAQPLVGGVYGGDPERLSLMATMPRFVEHERRHGSVVRGMREGQRRAAEQRASGARYGLFFAFDRGMQVLVDALAERAGERLRLSQPARAIEARPRGWTVTTEGGERIDADQLVLAGGAWTAARLLEPHHRKLGDALLAIPHGSAATVTFAWMREEVPHPMDAFGFVVPLVERRDVLAGTFASVKWPGRAPEGEVLIRAFIGGPNERDLKERDDASLIRSARRELRALMGIEAEPRFSLVTRYLDAMPQYQVGHLARVDAIEAMERELPRFALAGNAFRGVGIPDTIAYAEAIAERLAS